MAVNPALIEEAAAALQCAGHGRKRQIAEHYASQWQCSVQTVYRQVSQTAAALRPRKKRSDAGRSDWSLAELEYVSAYLMESRRATGKRLASIEDAIDTLRANDLIQGTAIDPATGEVRALSASSCARALSANRLHPDQLCAPAPKVLLSSEHPNQVWQADPSLCVLYYLKRQDGLRVMPQSEFYKNKPRNIEKVSSDRVWRYVFTDHTSGAFYVEYVYGAESGENLCRTFINAMQARGAADPFCGAPRMIMVDPGSANTGAMFRNLCSALQIELQVNKPGQPWAKGQVEKTNDIIECRFEHRLRFHRVADLAALNESAWRWMRQFNATAQHSRHKSSRYQAWLSIQPDQLRIPPAAEDCLRLASRAPESRLVSTQLQISFAGQQYDVSGVPGVIVGCKLLVARNAFGSEHGAQVLVTDEAGHVTWYALEPVGVGAYGFSADAVPIGTYRRHADTQADTNRKRIERLVTGAGSDAEAERARKEKALPFSGQIDPYKSIQTAPTLAHLPRRGEPMKVATPSLVTAKRYALPSTRCKELPPLNHVEAAVRLKPLVERAGQAWTADHYARTAARWPEGLPIDQVESWALELSAPSTGLRLVGGAA